VDNAVETIIRHWQAVQLRKGMYIQPLNAESVRSYLYGFEMGCSVLGFEFPRDLWLEVAASRGWACGSGLPEMIMRERGLSEEAIIDEMIAIEILTLQELT
jgi:hypothetical protein